MRTVFRTLAVASAALALSAGSARAQITATFYANNSNGQLVVPTPTPTLGSALSGVFCTATVNAINFDGGPAFSALWSSTPGCTNPTPTSFSSRFTGTIIAPTAGTYTIKYMSDDGAMFFINGAMVRNDWVPQTASNESFQVVLNAGVNTFQFDHYANNLLPSVFKVKVEGAQFGVVPEPSTYALLATGLAGLGVVARRRRRA